MMLKDKVHKAVNDRQWGRCASCGDRMKFSDRPRPLYINEFRRAEKAPNVVLLCKTCHPRDKRDFGKTHVPHLPERWYRFFYGHR